MKSEKVICVAGKNLIAVEGLKYCLNNHSDKNICFLPHSLDDGIDNWQPSFKKFGLKNNIKEVTLEEIYKLENLIFFSLEYADLISTQRFNSNELFNIHFSLLPKYKGMYTSAHPLLNGEKESGVTIHKIDDGIDTGDIICQIKFGIDLTDTAESLYKKYLHYSIKLFKENADNLINKNYISHPQNSSNSSYYSKKSIIYNDLIIDFKKTAFEIHNQFRAFTFRNYQLPKYENWNIIESIITKQKSNLKAGMKVSEDTSSFTIATIDYDLKLIKDYYPLLWQSSRKNDLGNLNLSLKNISNVDLKNKQGWNAIIIACYNGSFETTVKLIEEGANPNSCNFKGTSALMYSFDFYTRSKNLEIFKFLLECNADRYLKDYKNKSLLDYIKERGFNELEIYF